MEPMYTKMLIAVLLLPVILISGIYLRKRSRPYNNILFSVHKIVAVILIIFALLVLRNFLRNTSTDRLIIYLAISTAVLLLFSFITGALQSFERPLPLTIVIIHKVSSYLMFICLPLSFILQYNM